MSRTWIAFVSLALTLLVGLGLYARWLANHREAALASAQASLNGLRSQAEKIEQRLAVAATGKVQPRRTSQERSGDLSTRRKAFPRARLPAFYTQQPELANALYRPLVRKYFGQFCVQAGLSSEQINAFETMLMEGGPSLESFLAPAAMTASVLPSDLEGMARAHASQRDAVVESVAELLGDAAARKFEATLATLGARDLVDQIAVHGFHAGAPLSSAQSARLFELLANAGPTQSSGMPEAETVDWPGVIQTASSFLTPPQLRSLEALRAKAAFDREYRRFTGFYAGETLPRPEP